MNRAGALYGIITKAIAELVVSGHGTDVWDAIQERAGVEVDFLVFTESYPDELSYRLIAAACEVLDCPSKDFMIRFGEHWVLKTGAESYGALLKSGGATLKEFLLNLPHFHTRVFLLFPNLKPPEFACTDVTENSLRLHYYSERGLTDFMTGLLQGLSKLFDTPIALSLVAAKDEGADHDVFEISWDTAPR